MSEADTRAKLIDPAIHKRGWTEDFIMREVTAGAVEIIGGRTRRGKGRMDYTLRVKVHPDAQPVAIALIEAKPESKPAGHGLEQAKRYAVLNNVPFVISSNGHQYVLYDRFDGKTTRPQPIAEFPTPDDLRARYEAGQGFSLADVQAQPLLSRYPKAEADRRYYQDAAARAVLEHIAQGNNRALLSLATGAGKTRIAVHLLRRVADADQLRRALFVCDRDELRSQAATAFHHAFGTDAAAISGANAQKNARVLIGTYQTLGLEGDDDASFLIRNYPENYFSHIVIDECHRSAWGKWSAVLERNPGAVQIGLTATPRRLAEKVGAEQPSSEDALITADNYRHFGSPVYEYDIAQGIEDGYLAACEIVQRDIFLEGKLDTEQVTGLRKDDLLGKHLYDSRTGERLTIEEAREAYEATSFERMVILPERVDAMTDDLFAHLLQSGGPEQKTIVFCASDQHADDAANALNNLYADWCGDTGRDRKEPYAFKCTAASGGSDIIPDFRGSNQRFFIATTVDLLTTGVDVPSVRNIVFFKYVRSPIAFYQMLGRGTRIDPATNKLMFRVYDYTDATRLFGEEFVSTIGAQSAQPDGDGVRPDPERIIQVQGIDVQVSAAGKLILAMIDGKTKPVTLEEYKALLAEKLTEQAASLEGFRERWVHPEQRKEMLEALVRSGLSPSLVRELDEMDDYDLYDVLGELAYGLAPKTRNGRVEAFRYKYEDWLHGMPPEAAATIDVFAEQFARAGTDELENPHIFYLPAFNKAGGLKALKLIGQPRAVLEATKQRMFAA